MNSIIHTVTGDLTTMERKQQQSLNEAISRVVLGELKQPNEDKFELGTPVVWKKSKREEYDGEVVMNPRNQKVKINGKWTMLGKGAIKGIITPHFDSFIVPDDWNDVEKI
jgi:hypothetical protein